MVDISSQNNKINVTVSSSGNTANTNVTPDYARYYSEKSKEWAISNRIVDNTDYSSKYYANESKKQADISTAKTTEVIESGNTAVSNIENARDNAITDIINRENVSVENVNAAGATQVANVNSAGTTQVNLAKEQVTLATNQANIAKNQATIATNKTTEVVASGNTALSNIDTAKSGALSDIADLKNTSITDITNLKNTSVSNITTAKNNAITSITTQETTSKNNVIKTGNEQVERVNLTGVDNRTPIFSKSEVETNEGVYQNVYDLKRSTFDLSKFGVVGNPTITDDGIASGFSASDYLVIDGEVETGSNFEIVVKAKTGSDILISRMLIGGRAASDGVFNLGIYQGKLYCSSNALYFLQIQGAIVQPNTEYYFKAGIKDNIPYVGISSDGLTYDVTNGTLKTYPPHLKLMIGCTLNSEYAWQGSIDLKNFSITVDGKEVFNGNKTGLDVIKPDNYTVVGSPTITNEGVASGFSVENYLTIPPVDVDVSKPFKFSGTFTTGADVMKSQAVFSSTIPSSVGITLGTHLDGYPIVYFPPIGTKVHWMKLSRIVSANTTYHYTLTFDGTKLTFNLTDGASYNLTGTPSTLDVNKLGMLSTLHIGINTSGSYVMQPDATIDLNAFKIYIDGNLIYQPCLKIPYTESKTGSKIVDVAYRERVIDLYEQEGKAGYYTIDEPNQNFTLPMGEIYGMIEKKVDMLQASAAGMPSDKYITLSIPSSGSQFIVPANGWFAGWTSSSTLAGAYVCFYTGSINDGYASEVYRESTISYQMPLLLPVKKGTVVTVLYENVGIDMFRFYYAEGNK